MEAIYAIDANNGLSKDGVIPWHSKKDMSFFYNKTKNNVVVMGKNTFFSLPEHARPLKNRLNIVLTSNPEQYNDSYLKKDLLEGQCMNVIFTDDVKRHEYILQNRSNHRAIYPFLCEDFKVFIIGGKSIYEQFIPMCQTVWVTRLKTDHMCDMTLDYDFHDFDQELVDEDDELTIFRYMKKGQIL